MSSFEVKVERVLAVEKHPNADRLSLVTIRGYHCVAANLDDGSFRYKPDDLVVYVPEGALVPEYLLKKYGFWDEKKGTGFLSGTHHNRVKAIKLRGELSQGIIFNITGISVPGPSFWPQIRPVILNDEGLALPVQEGDDVASFLGIVKYEPPIPTNMAGKIYSIGGARTFNYDIDNIKERPRAFDGKDVVFTEKLHGTLCVVGYIPEMEDSGKLFDGCFISSKGMFAKGLVLDNGLDNARDNLYVRTVLELGLTDKVRKISKTLNQPIYLFGEIIGRGVQDLWYGQQTPTFRAFDIFSIRYPGTPEVEKYAYDFDYYKGICLAFDIPTVPVVYVGPFSAEKGDGH